jgi:hypothetical protein
MAAVALGADEVQVSIGSTLVGVLEDADTSTYAPVLEWVHHPIESSGIVIIDTEGHPGSHFKLYPAGPCGRGGTPADTAHVPSARARAG